MRYPEQARTKLYKPNDISCQSPNPEKNEWTKIYFDWSAVRKPEPQFLEGITEKRKEEER